MGLCPGAQFHLTLISDSPDLPDSPVIPDSPNSSDLLDSPEAKQGDKKLKEAIACEILFSGRTIHLSYYLAGKLININ